MLIWLRIRLALVLAFAMLFAFVAVGTALFDDADGHRSFSTTVVAAACGAALLLGAVCLWLILDAARQELSQRAPKLTRARYMWLLAGRILIGGVLAAVTIAVIEWVTGYQGDPSFIGIVLLNAGITALLLIGLSRWIHRLAPGGRLTTPPANGRS